MKTKIAKDILLGLAVGDALGVPVEFRSRRELISKPVTGMRGFGSHNQPAGTWSDDSSLAFCLAESLCRGYDINDIASNFIKWLDESWWTAHHEVFDIGISTREALRRLKNGISPVMSGGSSEYDNGNGSLMRIMPLLALTEFKFHNESLPFITAVSSITHRHPRSILACAYLLIFASNLRQYPFDAAMVFTRETMTSLMKDNPELAAEQHYFNKVLFEYPQQQGQQDNPWETLRKIPAEEIKSSGYVVHTLEAALWCMANTGNYKDAVLKAVNLGDDTDTTGAVTGALAGIAYGYHTIPPLWLETLVRSADIITLAGRLDEFYLSYNFNHKCPVCGSPMLQNNRYTEKVCTPCNQQSAPVV